MSPSPFSAARRWLLSLGLAAVLCGAEDMRPVVGPGATKDEVIKAYGWPTGQSQLGTKEILNYPQGSVTLADGRVERVNFSPNVAWPAPKPRPAAATPTTAKRPETSTATWLTSFPDAAREALQRRVRILAAFTGSDWSPPSKRFLDEVAPHPEFADAFAKDFVFLKLDFPTHTAPPPELRKQNEELRARCGVTTYPALVILSANGEPDAIVELMKQWPGDSYRAQMIAAVAEVRDLLKQSPPLAAEVKPAATPAPGFAAAAPTHPALGDKPATPGEERGFLPALFASAGWALGLGLGGGLILAGALVWWLWKSRLEGSAAAAAAAQPRTFGPALRLNDLPSNAELASWPAERVRSLAAALFEATGYTAQSQPAGSGVDLGLLRRGHTKANVLVSCRPASLGAVGVKPVRELFGTLVATGVEAGWIVAPGGFTDEAQAEGQERGIELIDANGLIERLRALPPPVLANVLGRTGA